MFDKHWAATSIRHCSQPPSVILWTSPSRRPSAGSSSSSPGLHYGPSWWLETEGWSPQTILAQNRGAWPAANESRTSDGETTRPGQIGMAATCGNGYVFDKLLKKKKLVCLYSDTGPETSSQFVINIYGSKATWRMEKASPGPCLSQRTSVWTVLYFWLIFSVNSLLTV